MFVAQCAGGMGSLLKGRAGEGGGGGECVCVCEGEKGKADVMWKDEAATSLVCRTKRCCLCVGARFHHVYSADIKRQSESCEFINKQECAISWNTRVTTKIIKP